MQRGRGGESERAEEVTSEEVTSGAAELTHPSPVRLECVMLQGSRNQPEHSVAGAAENYRSLMGTFMCELLAGVRRN